MPAGNVNNEDPQRHADLRRRQPDSRRRVHGLDHVVDQLLQRVIDVLDRLRLAAQHAVRVGADG